MRAIPIFLAAIVLAAGAAGFAFQQAPPATEVYLTELQPAGGARRWINVSDNPGYDNQPSFLPDSTSLLFASNRDGKQTDIFRFDISARTLTQLTRTAEQEYSPTVTPDGRTFSTVRVEADGTQRLWRFDLNGSNPRLVLENVKPVGYHAWIDASHVALFILGSGGQPATLQLADTGTGEATVMDTGIGRSVLIRPSVGTVSYMTTGQARAIKELDPKTRTTATLLAPLDGSQDAAWLPDGRLLMAKGTAILQARPGAGGAWSAWEPFIDLAAGAGSPAVGSVTRMAVSPNGRWLAFVAEPGQP